MNKIVAINGSPKPKHSASSIFISQVEVITGTEFDLYQATKLIKLESPSDTISKILKTDTLLFVFPLYIDSLPAPLIKVLTFLEEGAVNTSGKLPTVYSICNCGFYEADNNRLALDIIRNFCLRARMSWGYGIGIGAGGFVSSQNKGKFDGPLADIHTALNELGKSMENHSSPGENIFLTPTISRSKYILGANKAWEAAADKYGQLNSIRARPHV